MLFFLGYWGVELFFVLSGFLIGGILIEKLFQAEQFNFSIIFSFWKKRWIRTIPIYLIALIINLVSLNYFIKLNTAIDVRYFLFLQNLFYKHPTFFPEAWSLAVEEWFYLTLPLFIWIGFLIPFRNKTKRLFSILLALLFCFTAIRFFKASSVFDIIQWDQQIRKVVLYRLDALLYGVLLALIYKTKNSFLLKNRTVFLLVGITLVIGSYFVFFKKYSALYNAVFFSSSTSLGFALLMVFFINWSGPKSVSFKNAVSFLSVISYSIYLIHYTFLFRLFNNFFIARTVGLSLLLTLAYLISAIVIAGFMYYYLEKPFLKLKEKIK